MNENELLEYRKMLDMITSYNKKPNEKKGEEAADFARPASPDEGPLPLPTPSLPNDKPASSDEGPLPLPTPSIPARPNVPIIPIIPGRPLPLPPWIDIKPNESCRGACLPFAYPRIEKRNINPASLCLIYEIMAGRTSALTSFLTYSYNSACFYNENNAGKIFRDLAICKENHLRMLSLFISLSGSYPKYQGCVRGAYTPWNISYLNYPTYLREAVLDAIDMETKTIENYNFAIAEARDPYISAFLKRLLMDNKYHLEILTELYNNCCS